MDHRERRGSDRSAGEGQRSGGFLGSPGNLVGLGALTVVLLLVLLLSQSVPAAVIAGLLGYGAGYFLAPDQARRPALETYASGVPVTGASQKDVQERLRALSSTIQSEHRRLPPHAHDELRQAMTQLEEMAQRWDTVATAPDHRHVVESIIYDYLPTTLDLFLTLPDSEKPHHAAEWTHQLGTLTTAIEHSREAVLRRDLEAMRTQGRLLEQRFEDGDLALFREHGL